MKKHPAWVDYTPGPWTERDCEIQGADGSPICEMFSRPEDDEKRGYEHANANSRLICNAPKMEAMLREFIETVALMRELDWKVTPGEYVGIITELERKAHKVVAI